MDEQTEQGCGTDRALLAAGGKTALLAAGGRLSAGFFMRVVRSFGGREVFYLAAVDGGLSACEEAGYVPDLILGDFDTIPPERVLRYEERVGTEIVRHNPVKDASDLELAADEVFSRGFRKGILIGALGGRADHSLANLRLLRAMARKGLELTILDPENRIRFFPAVPEEERVLNFIRTDKRYFSFFVWGGAAKVTLDGFKYPLKDALITDDSPPSFTISNEIASAEGRVSFTGTEGAGLLVLETSDLPEGQE